MLLARVRVYYMSCLWQAHVVGRTEDDEDEEEGSESKYRFDDDPV